MTLPMTLSQHIEAYYDTTSVPYEDEQEALNMIFEGSDFITGREEFARKNITQEDAEAIALSNKHFISDYVANNSLSMELIASAITEHPELLAHYLAFSEPTLATQLLDELLYYRAQGRI